MSEFIQIDNPDGQITAQLKGKTIRSVWKGNDRLIFECTDGHFVHIGLGDGGFRHIRTDVNITLPGVECTGLFNTLGM